eukprot:TRINITY_DN4428_c0_g1_i1.p1 TRINITY_DN4428_c0_g1~~TRINITY_DN4428_c0_g1_i1.p1  ORF type:complete len:530 (+),score=65.84 TRINITY_DN4428_c0_g1_i1:31-1590(+)
MANTIRVRRFPAFRRLSHCNRNGAASFIGVALAVAALSSIPVFDARGASVVADLDDDDEFAPSCPAGRDGDTCRAEAEGSAQTHDWRSFPGCAIPAGDDIGEPEFLTVGAAKRRCGDLERCIAFTFDGNDPDGPLSGAPVWVHLKESFDCVEAEWISYRKVERRRTGVGATAPAPPPPPPPPPPRSARSNEGTSTTLGKEEEEDNDHYENGEGVAVCLSGQVRMLEVTASALRQNFLEPLSPDVFMYGPRDTRAQGDPNLYELEDYVVSSRWEDEDIRTQLYAETRNPGRTIDLEYIGVQGNWFGNQCLRPALRDNRPGSAICLYYNQQRCLDMVRNHEAERGRPYAWVVVSRTDFRWMAPHPPLDLLSGDAVWIPSGSDWEGGINDRHAVVPRRYVDAYLSGWSLITRGQAKDVMLDTLGSMKVMGYPGPNTECFLRARLAHYGVPVERFPNVAYLTCTQRTKSRWTQCSGTATNDAPGWLYKEEMEHATRVAKCVRSVWTQRKMDDCRDDISHLYLR